MSDDFIMGFLYGFCVFPLVIFVVRAIFEKAVREIEKDFSD